MNPTEDIHVDKCSDGFVIDNPDSSACDDPLPIYQDSMDSDSASEICQILKEVLGNEDESSLPTDKLQGNSNSKENYNSANAASEGGPNSSATFPSSKTTNMPTCVAAMELAGAAKAVAPPNDGAQDNLTNAMKEDEELQAESCQGEGDSIEEELLPMSESGPA